MRATFVTVFLLFVTGSVTAEKIKVYKWVDKNGVVTFSEYRPPETEYIELEIEGDRVIGGQSEGLDYDLSSLQRDNVDEGVVDELNQKATEYCDKAKHNLNVLDSFNNVRVLDERGQPKVLSQEEISQQRRLANRQIELFCSKPPQNS